LKVETARLKIAVLIDWYLPGTKAGGPVRSVFSMVELLKEEFDLYVITSAYDLGAREPYPGITTDRLEKTGGVFYYYSSGRGISSSQLRNLFATIRPDLIYLNSFWSFSFSINVLLMKKRGQLQAPVILAPRGMLGSGALHLKAAKKRFFLWLSKVLGLHRNVIFHATQEDEAADIRKMLPGTSVRIAPNINTARPTINKSVKHKGELQLFFLSRISRVKNLHYALEALSGVDGSYRVEFDLYGNVEDAQYWEKCLELISSLPAHIRVRHKGELPFHQVQQTIVNYHALLLPTLNENFGHAIMESLMCGCLVIISDQTPWTGVNNIGGFALPLDRQAQFTAAIETCAAMDEEEFSRRSLAAIDYVRGKTDLASAAAQYQQLFYGTPGN
jgi:glycosyltransferase involved in cell wall biosynthesis